MTPMPMTVVSGYLGAGKTTLINRMLADPQGLRLMVMVNDFGAINIDETLIARQSDDVIALTNGCVCCTMGADFYMALGRALDRRPRADHLIVEASGIADPQAIANTALAEPDLRYAGIVTLVDALNITGLLGDPLIAAQVRQQIKVADLVLQTKIDLRTPEVDAVLAANGLAPPDIMPSQAIAPLMLNADPIAAPTSPASHPDYTSWQHCTAEAVDHDDLLAALGDRPDGLYRMKGIVLTNKGWFDVHAVGSHSAVTPTQSSNETTLVGVGLKERLSLAAVGKWWARVGSADFSPQSTPN